jgi:hypothetical protein
MPVNSIVSLLHTTFVSKIFPFRLLISIGEVKTDEAFQEMFIPAK